MSMLVDEWQCVQNENHYKFSLMYLKIHKKEQLL